MSCFSVNPFCDVSCVLSFSSIQRMAIFKAELERQVEVELDTNPLRAFDPGVPTLCESCQTEFSLISIHKKIFHSGKNKENKCAFCGMPFVSRKRLLDHLDVHSDGNDLFCCICLGEQKSDDALAEHLETHRELHVFLCVQCRRTFASKAGMSGHDCVPQVSIDVEDNKTVQLQIVPDILMETNGVPADTRSKNDEEVRVSLPKAEDGSGPSQTCETPILAYALSRQENQTSTFVDGMESVRIAITDRPPVNIGQRQLGSPESTFSESLVSRVSSSETASDPLQYSNRDDGNLQPVTASNNGSHIKEDDLIDVTRVKLETDEHQDTTDHCNYETLYIKVEPDTHQEPLIDHCVCPDQSGETDSVNVEFGAHQKPITGVCAGADQNGETDSVTVEFNTHQSSAGTPFLSHDMAVVALPETPADTAGAALPETPPTCLGDRGGDSINHAQWPSTAVNVDTTNRCTFDAELPQPAALPPDLKTEKEVPEESHTDPRSTVDIKLEEDSTQLREERTTCKSVSDHSESKPEDAFLKQIDNRRVRSTRKRSHAATMDRVNGENVSPSGVQTFVGERAELQLADRTEPTPPDSPAPSKKKRISFNEQIEFWNPILRERAWLDITEEFPEVREVPLLTKSKKKKDKKKSKKKKKSKSKHSKKNSAIFKEEKSKSESLSPGSRENTSNADVAKSDGFSTPTKPAGPIKLRPVLKPSPSPQAAAPTSELNRKGRWGRVPAQSDQLFKKFGSDFSYTKCLKVDGRFHCPDNDCRNNNDRGFSTDKSLRYHIRQNHIQAPTYECSLCKKSFPAPHKVKEHMVVHNAPDSYSCPVCDKKFKTKLSVKAHQMLHDQPFQCYHCKLRFARKESVRVHIRTVECSCCDIMLRCIGLFRRHEVEVPHIYKCTGCKKKLRSLRDFNWHVRNVHYDESTALDGTWICHLCKRKFTTRHIAMRHARKKHTACRRDKDSESEDSC